MPFPAGHAGMPVAELLRKKIPFDPLSMKLPEYEVPFVGKIATIVPFGSAGRTVALPKALFDRVSIPKTSEPVTLAAPEADTAGNWTITPLLSAANIETGFATCAPVETAATEHDVGELQP